MTIDLQPGKLTLGMLKQVYLRPGEIKLRVETYDIIKASNQAVHNVLENGQTVYGINTGFGLLAQKRIEKKQLAELQSNLVLSHCTGVGDEIGSDTVRLILFLKINSLARGYSGISVSAIEALMAFYNLDILPCIPAKGSVGASGDLAPLAHMTAALMGVGDVIYKGERLTAEEALGRAGLQKLELGPKEGLAFLNGTQVSTGLALASLFDTENLYAAAVTAGAMSVDALQGTDVPFDSRIHELRNHPGQSLVAKKYLKLLQGSEIRASHINCDRVQDPYSLRCQPQVMGACLDIIQNVGGTLLTEANAVTDNPLIYTETGDVLSGGNFHAEPVALAADTLALAIAEIASLSERRIALLIDPKMSGLPAFLVENSGLNSGFMIAHVTAAAMTSENKSLAHPASVDSIPTSANQEDHVSMATFAARRLKEMVDNSANVIAIELLAAAQGIEFHQPKTTSSLLREVLKRLRKVAASYAEDRFFSPDISAAKSIIESGYFLDFVGDILPSSHSGNE